MTKPNKYGFLPAARQNLPAEVESAPADDATAPEPPGPIATAPKGVASADPPTLPRTAGRAPGKRSDRAYSQRTAYLPLRLHHEVDVALKADNLAAIEQGGSATDFSDLVAELLSAWLADRPVK